MTCIQNYKWMPQVKLPTPEMELDKRAGALQRAVSAAVKADTGPPSEVMIREPSVRVDMVEKSVVLQLETLAAAKAQIATLQAKADAAAIAEASVPPAPDPAAVAAAAAERQSTRAARLPDRERSDVMRRRLRKRLRSARPLWQRSVAAGKGPWRPRRARRTSRRPSLESRSRSAFTLLLQRKARGRERRDRGEARPLAAVVWR